MADTKFTALGMSGSGKTCYLLGMYHEMSQGVRGFTLATTNQVATKLDDWMDQLDYETGMDRFPAGTSLTEFSDYSFKLSYCNEPIMSFDWADYGGGTMRARENNPEVFAKLNDSIEKSSVLYIFIDGDLFCSDDTETKIKNVKRKCSRTINGYIQRFSESHENLPPIVFVVTKADLCEQYLEPGEITYILEEAFSNVFYSENLIYVVAVSLGEEISDDDYSVDVEPVNIHIPFFIGIFHEFLNYCYYLKEKLSKKQQEHQNRISANKDAIDYENSRWFFTDEDRIARCNKQIEEEKKKINNNIELFDRYRKLLTAIADELTKTSKNFIVLKNGNEINFSFKDFISEI